MSSDNPNYIHLFDTTLRDGAQTQGVDFTAANKVTIAHALDTLGIDYIEGGWPGANATDDQFFLNPPVLSNAKLVSFGMTRRPGRSAENDPVLAAVLQGKSDAACLVGKSSSHQVKVALQIEPEENLRMVADSIRHAAANRAEALYDAEHFFDGYAQDPDYSISALKAALDAGARWVVLCDTNGGTLPFDVERVVKEVLKHIPGDKLGVHFHNDTGCAVANSLVAVEAGARHVQGTLNGLGERCGNANILTIIANLKLKTKYEVGVSDEGLKTLTSVSRMLDDILNRPSDTYAPFVGASSFAHKAGLHVSAIMRDPTTYEHVAPDSVGNKRHIVMSDQAGRSNLITYLNDFEIEIDPKDPRVGQILEKVKKVEEEDGLTFDGAEASFELFVRGIVEGKEIEFFKLDRFRVIDERRLNSKSEWVTDSVALVQLDVGSKAQAEAGIGRGPIDSLNEALRKTLHTPYPVLQSMRLVDYKVRIIDPQAATGAKTRVIIESEDPTSGLTWRTVGVSTNIIDASYQALKDAINWRLLKAR
ncbi:MAG: citramalate synthase [Alphaproteobacteria bacterium]